MKTPDGWQLPPGEILGGKLAQGHPVQNIVPQSPNSATCVR